MRWRERERESEGGRCKVDGGRGRVGGRVRDEMQGGWREDVESEKEDMGVVEWVGVDRGTVHARNLLPITIGRYETPSLHTAIERKPG